MHIYFFCFSNRTYLSLFSRLVNFFFLSQVNDIPSSSSEVKPEKSKLDTRVAKFISLICNVSMMAQHMMEIGSLVLLLPLHSSESIHWRN